MSVSNNARRKGGWGLAALATVATGAVLVLSGGGSAVADRLESPSAASKIEAVQAPQKQAYAVLERPQQAGDALGTTRVGPFGTNLQLARSVETSEGDVHVVPGDDVVCLRAEDEVGHGYACGPTDVVEDGVLMIALHDQSDDSVTVYGLVPDDAGDVELTTPDGTETLDVADNVFSAELDSSVGASVQTEGTTGTYPVP